MSLFTIIKNRKKVLGMNARRFARPNLRKDALEIADNKLLAKKVLKEANLPILETYQTLKTIEEVENFDYTTLPKSFVLKPNAGLGGEGIMVVFGKKKKEENIWVKDLMMRVSTLCFSLCLFPGKAQLFSMRAVCTASMI